MTTETSTGIQVPASFVYCEANRQGRSGGSIRGTVHHGGIGARLSPLPDGFNVIFANGQFMSRVHVCQQGGEDAR